MVGELDVAIADQNAKIEFRGDQIRFRFADFASARAIAAQPMSNPTGIGNLLSFSQIGLGAQIGTWKAIELFPQPSWIVKLLSPAIRKMVKAAR